MDASLNIDIVEDVKRNIVKDIASLNDYIQNRKRFRKEKILKKLNILNLVAIEA